MNSMNTIVQVVPVLKTNNRKNNLDFYCQTLGMTNLLEEGGLVSLGDQTKTEHLVIEESPSTRSRRVQAPKKLAKIIIKVEHPKEIEALLARQRPVTRCYRGENGYAFEAYSPEGDCFLLHAEEDVTSLRLLQDNVVFEVSSDFSGLTQFQVEQIQLHQPAQELEEFYQPLLAGSNILQFISAEGPDLKAENSKVWDVTRLEFKVKNFSITALEEVFQGRERFIPKSKRFFVTHDTSRIEVWVEER